jgi:hypothetical protein
VQGRSRLSTPEQLFSNRSLRIGRHTSIVASNLPEAALSFAGVLRRPRRFSVRLFVQDADFLFERDFMSFAGVAQRLQAATGSSGLFRTKLPLLASDPDFLCNACNAISAKIGQ